MSIIRNPEIGKEYLLLSLITLFGAGSMGIWLGFRAALGTGGVCALMWIVFAAVNHLRYQRLSALGEQLDKILHGEDVSMLENCCEGELAVLSAQIKKVVWRLWEQQSSLEEEKKLLVDSLADISHQIKTPLTSIHLILSFLQEDPLSRDRKRELVKKLSILTERIDWMVYALLHIAKLEAGTVTLQRTYFTMDKLVQKCYDSLAIPMELRGIAFRSLVPEGAGMTGDIVWMTEAVTNVMKNCMEHTPAGGEVCVRVEDNPLYLAVYVEDTGDGIAEKDLPHIFERFYRGENADENSVGIGLALSRQIVSSQNGTIRAYNKRRGQGAVFEIRCYKTVV